MSALLYPESPEAPLFSDGIGDRVVSTDGATGDLVQVLRINPTLTAVPSFEFALRERVARLANFRHGYYARVRRVDRSHAHGTGLAVVSDHVEGTRLSDILRVAHERGLLLDINAAVCLIRQLVPAVALLHENARDVAHGLIAPERLLVTPHARLVIAEHVMGAAIEQMQYGRERLWNDFRIAMPASAGIARFDQRADVAGIGVVALSLVLGRPLAADEYPRGLNDLLNGARERTALGEEQPLSAPLRNWLARALQVDVRRAFASAPEALAALEQLSAEGSDYVAAPVALETFLSRYIAALLTPAAVRPVAPTPAAAAPVAPAPPPPIPVAAAPAPFAPPMPVVPPTPVAPPPAPVAAAPIVAPPPAPVIEPLAGSIETVDPYASSTTDHAPLFNPDKPFGTPDPAEIRAVFDEHPAELDAEMAAVTSRPARPAKIGRKALIAVAAALVLATGGYVALQKFTTPAVTVPPAMATLSVQSNPPGVPVFVDGVERGMTPARVTLAPGAHILELRGRGVPRVIPVTLAAGADVSQYLEFAEAPLPEQPLTVPAPAAATVPAPAPVTPSAVDPSVPVAGWITVRLPFSVEIRENGRVVGTNDADRLMLTAGKHQLEFVNETLAFSVARTVQVTPGKVTPVPLELPKGVVNLNAAPWAEVWIDGVRVGETPIGNLSVAVGPHEVVFKHPQFGEKRHAISVTVGAPVRLSIDMK
jgi:PEGA domain-containing protein